MMTECSVFGYRRSQAGILYISTICREMMALHPLKPESWFPMEQYLFYQPTRSLTMC
jgi:hypothetical protein